MSHFYHKYTQIIELGIRVKDVLNQGRLINLKPIMLIYSRENNYENVRSRLMLLCDRFKTLIYTVYNIQ